MKATMKLGILALVSFIPMMVLADVNESVAVKKAYIAPPHQEVLNEPAARAPAPPPSFTVETVNITVLRSVDARPRAVKPPCKDGEVRTVGALRAAPEGAVGVRKVTIRCHP